MLMLYNEGYVLKAVSDFVENVEMARHFFDIKCRKGFKSSTSNTLKKVNLIFNVLDFYLLILRPLIKYFSFI